MERGRSEDRARSCGGIGAGTGMAQLRDVVLDDKYRLAEGRVFMTGVQALVRLPLEQRRRDLAAGRETAGHITGYPRAPPGGHDPQPQGARGLPAGAPNVPP